MPPRKGAPPNLARVFLSKILHFSQIPCILSCMKNNSYIINGKSFPFVILLVEVDKQEELWCISTEALNYEIENTEHYPAMEVVDEQVMFFVPDDIIYSDKLVDFLKEHFDVEFTFIEYVEQPNMEGYAS